MCNEEHLYFPDYFSYNRTAGELQSKPEQLDLMEVRTRSLMY